MPYKSLLIVIPTRNRSDFAINAVNSVLHQKDCDFEILVSDNSTEAAEVEVLSSFCENLKDERVRYLRPPEPLSMTKHYDWAMRRALELSDFSHVAFLTDRFVFIENSLSVLQKILIKHPEKVVSYNSDTIDDSTIPVKLIQGRWSGQLFELETAHIIQTYSQIGGMSAFPVPQNSAAPRPVINACFEKYGYYFTSVSPDYHFAFRALEMLDSILFYDKRILLNYGMSRSNGLNILRGTHQKDSKDFLVNLDSADVCFETPVKFVAVVPNATIHEYYAVKQATENSKFPEINREIYLQLLAYKVLEYGELQLRTKMIKDLKAAIGLRIYSENLKSYLQYRRNGLRVKLHNYFNPSNPYLLVTNFEDVPAAIDHAGNSPRPPFTDKKFIEERIGLMPDKENSVKVLETIN